VEEAERGTVKKSTVRRKRERLMARAFRRRAEEVERCPWRTFTRARRRFRTRRTPIAKAMRASALRAAEGHSITLRTVTGVDFVAYDGSILLNTDRRPLFSNRRSRKW
jgi:hypothetical protein